MPVLPRPDFFRVCARRFSPRSRAALLVALCLSAGTALTAGGASAEAKFMGSLAALPPGKDVTWGKTITLTTPDGTIGRYPRLVKVASGNHAGDLLLTYQTQLTGGDFMMYRSSDKGQSWTGPVKINDDTDQWDFASCNIIQLKDGRLLMTMQRRVHGSNLGGDYFIDVRYSPDGGDSWSKPEQVFQGANWEGRAMQMPHDANGDGVDDIYLFFTQRIIETTLTADKAKRAGDNGRGVSYIVTYDGGKTWIDPNPERYTGKMIHRNFDLRKGIGKKEDGRSGGGMPQPFLLPNNRVGFVAEEANMKHSPYIVANDPGDWDWKGAAFQGPWTSADYPGKGDRNTYPSSPQNAWPAETGSFGNGPYAAVLADGRVIMASRNEKVVAVWVGDKTAHNFKLQELPFDRTLAAYPFIEPLDGNQILVAGGAQADGENRILLRFGTVK